MIFFGISIVNLNIRITFVQLLISNKDCVGLSTLTLDKP